MRSIVAADPRNRERVLPFLNGEDINTSPTQLPSRFINDFGELSEAEARGGRLYLCGTLVA